MSRNKKQPATTSASNPALVEARLVVDKMLTMKQICTRKKRIRYYLQMSTTTRMQPMVKTCGILLEKFGVCVKDEYEAQMTHAIDMMIIRYTIRTDQFLKQDLLEDSDTETWMDLLDEMTTVLFRLAAVSKQFHHNVPTTIRLDALVRTTSFNLIDVAFEQTQSLTIVGATTDWNSYSGVDNEEVQKNKEISRRLFCTFQAAGSMPNLKKLKVVGRAFKTHKQQAETGGQYYIWYIISNVGCKLEEFEIQGRVSLGDMGYDAELVEYLFKHLKVIRLKYTRIEKIAEARAIREMIHLIEREKLPSCRLELYYGDNQSWDDEDGYKLVQTFDDKIDKLIGDEEGMDSDDSDFY
ncbi:hypothetical protein DFA_03109 [Cavenderia fasciculata]|uniref:Uncharacterized protein n=1 Tax=Cavenderia fasciculata TaxID=261658 RepID=F4PGN0_CACFS|nr:uncharacterized protein DFA_03109 [Cavenderia fasciculata]EGG24864.1 hypothetical protein DFA_03109 [Cavenderia fasciculata]|eukprot:XP_004362715.1 hypothetical protein DFA_03109 [Cavenderia fasciculata]